MNTYYKIKILHFIFKKYITRIQIRHNVHSWFIILRYPNQLQIMNSYNLLSILNIVTTTDNLCNLTHTLNYRANLELGTFIITRKPIVCHFVWTTWFAWDLSDKDEYSLRCRARYKTRRSLRRNSTITQLTKTIQFWINIAT